MSWGAEPGARQAVSGFQMMNWTSLQNLVFSVFLVGQLYEHLKTWKPHESLWRESFSVYLAFVFPWLSFVLLEGVFKIGLIKAQSPPAQYHNPPNLCNAGSSVQDILNPNLENKTGILSSVLRGCRRHVLAQDIPWQPHSGDEKGPFTALDESQQQEELLGAATASVKMICILQRNKTGVHPLVLL